MIRTKDELISMISQRIGEDNSDDAITLLEDISDTFTDFENKTADAKNIFLSINNKSSIPDRFNYYLCSNKKNEERLC